MFVVFTVSMVALYDLVEEGGELVVGTMTASITADAGVSVLTS